MRLLRGRHANHLVASPPRHLERRGGGLWKSRRNLQDLSHSERIDELLCSLGRRGSVGHGEGGALVTSLLRHLERWVEVAALSCVMDASPGK